MPYMTYTQLKNSAKMRMAPVMGKLVGIAAIQIGLSILITQVASIPSLLTSSPGLMTAVYLLSTTLSGTLTGMLDGGIRYPFLKLYCGRPFSTGDIFHTFTARLKTCAGLSFAIALIRALPVVPFYYFNTRFELIMQDLTMSILSSPDKAADISLPPEAMTNLTLALFCLTPALIITVLLGLVYSQVYYLMLDFPSHSVRELLKNSRLLMRGHKGRLFYIQVCFLPLMILCALTCGIGMLWISPFVYAVETEFYLDLVTKRSLRNQSARRA